jgi:DNA-binding Lrp family transcriptional regulator
LSVATWAFARTGTAADHPRTAPIEEETMVSAYILIQTEVGKAAQVTDQIRDIEGVTVVDPVTGPYDIVARAEAADLDVLAKGTVLPMQDLEGITRTLTCPVLQF